MKCAFLLALSSGRRVSELHALQRSVYDVNDTMVRLQVEGSFTAKTQKIGSEPLSVEVKSNPENAELCPLQTLLQYISDTNQIAKDSGTDKLFLSYVRPHKPVSKNSLARWIATVIRDAYSQLANTPSANAHEVRAIASSMFVGPMDNHDDILAAGLWSSKWSFLGFYKRHIPAEWDFSQFGSLVVVNKVIEF